MTTFATIKQGADIIGKQAQTAHDLWRQGDHDACLSVLEQMLQDAETVRRQIFSLKTDLHTGQPLA